MSHRSALAIPAGSIALALALVLGGSAAPVGARERGSTPADSVAEPVFDRDTLAGRSGKLWIRLVTSEHPSGLRTLTRLFGESAARTPGVYTALDGRARPFTFAHLVPFSAKERGQIRGYRLGAWPSEVRRAVASRYANPPGFIEVTPDNQETRVSEHFRLKDFLTKDQHATWPKYLALREPLVDKLELVIAALGERGIAVSRMAVMSGFRTPQYNQRGVGAGGRAPDSRHQYGDAADVYVDNDGDGRMDDLNRDGRVSIADARLLAAVVDQVEQRHGDLTGGVGIYAANSVHGPFVHVDVRGTRARW